MVLTKANDEGELRYLIKTDAYRDWNAKFLFLTITRTGGQNGYFKRSN
tara:strand:+ start:111 stop:254 length:144 start_codon:yes stop_codon:yes gene_type:complete